PSGLAFRLRSGAHLSSEFRRWVTSGFSMAPATGPRGGCTGSSSLRAMVAIDIHRLSRPAAAPRLGLVPHHRSHAMRRSRFRFLIALPAIVFTLSGVPLPATAAAPSATDHVPRQETRMALRDLWVE